MADPTGFEALHWVVCHAGFSRSAAERADRAAALLVEYHLGCPDLRFTCGRLTALTDPTDRAPVCSGPSTPAPLTRGPAEAVFALADVQSTQADGASNPAGGAALFARPRGAWRR